MKCLDQEASLLKNTATNLLPCPDKEPSPVTTSNTYNNIKSAKEYEDEVFQLIIKAMQLYNPNEILISFNGGKDCTVVLHILAKFFQQNCLKHFKIPALYIRDDNAFEEVDEFVESCTKLYNIELIVRKGRIKDVLFELLEEMPQIKAVFMGSRRTDPCCNELKIMQACDPGWPPLMRINPIIDWKCADVWSYLKTYNVPYCSLYDLGYTSIGNKLNTEPNPHLLFRDETNGSVKYKPAYELRDDEYDSLERAGRLNFRNNNN